MLRPQPSPQKGALLFSERDMARVLGYILDVSGAPANDVIAACDYVIGQDKCSVQITLTLNVVKDPGPDRRLAEGIKQLFLLESEGVRRPCLITEAGVKLAADDYAGDFRLQGAYVCRVITRASHESIRAALVARGVPAADIFQISAKAIGDSGVPGNTVIIRLKPGFPVDRVPWKIPLQEPGLCLAPRKVSLQGHKGCTICRDLGHNKSACKCSKEDLCGRCTFPFAALIKQGRNPRDHDCEGGPTGYGAAHLDPMGEGWHQLRLQFEASRAAPAESEDPIPSRSSDLQAARDLADIARAQLALGGKKKKKKVKRKEPPSPAPGDRQQPHSLARSHDLDSIGPSSLPVDED